MLGARPGIPADGWPNIFQAGSRAIPVPQVCIRANVFQALGGVIVIVVGVQIDPQPGLTVPGPIVRIRPDIGWAPSTAIIIPIFILITKTLVCTIPGVVLICRPDIIPALHASIPDKVGILIFVLVGLLIRKLRR